MNRKKITISLIVLLAILMIISVVFLLWASNPAQPSEVAIYALQSDEIVQVESAPEWIVFRPSVPSSNTGLIFYPGGHVDYRAYALHLRNLASRGFLVVLVRMPLSLAVFAPDKADMVMAAFPEITSWVIGGHSLGGAMASAYVYQNPTAVQGLLLWASYPADNNSLADRHLKVLSVFGTEDGQAAKIASSGALLPPDMQWIVIQGGNHAQFGDYGEQPGDNPARISPDEQRLQVVESTVEFLQNLQ